MHIKVTYCGSILYHPSGPAHFWVWAPHFEGQVRRDEAIDYFLFFLNSYRESIEVVIVEFKSILATISDSDKILATTEKLQHLTNRPSPVTATTLDGICECQIYTRINSNEHYVNQPNHLFIKVFPCFKVIFKIHWWKIKEMLCFPNNTRVSFVLTQNTYIKNTSLDICLQCW